MAEKLTALHAIYVLDGVQEEYTPAQLLDAVTEPEGRHPLTAPAEERAVDETLDPVFRGIALEPGCTDAYLEAVLAAKKLVPATCTARSRCAGWPRAASRRRIPSSPGL